MAVPTGPAIVCVASQATLAGGDDRLAWRLAWRKLAGVCCVTLLCGGVAGSIKAIQPWLYSSEWLANDGSDRLRVVW